MLWGGEARMSGQLAMGERRMDHIRNRNISPHSTRCPLETIKHKEKNPKLRTKKTKRVSKINKWDHNESQT